MGHNPPAVGRRAGKPPRDQSPDATGSDPPTERVAQEGPGAGLVAEPQ
jgi:hypothetical protein